MKKKLISLLTVLLVSTVTYAQFEAGKLYAGASLSGLNLSYNGTDKTQLNLGAKLGYLVEDNWMVTAQGQYDYHKYAPNNLQLGVGARYYIVQNGLFLGAGVNYLHQNHDYDDFMPTVQLGYAFFLSRTVTIEPELYYNQSLKNHNDFSGVGFRIGFGIYLE